MKEDQKTVTTEYKVDQETATADFDRFTESMDLDVDPVGMDDEDKIDFERHRGKLIEALRVGSLVINDTGEPVFTPQRETGTPITFHEPRGSALMAMDRKKKNHDMGKLFATMAEMTGCNPGTFSKMRMPDLKICMAIVTLFLA